MYIFMQVSNLFYCRHFGFRSKMSIMHALMDTTEVTRKNTHLDVSNMLLDRRKAFDGINHETFLYNKESHGVRGLCSEWFRSYLNKHTQCVANFHQYSNTLVLRVVYHKDRCWERYCFQYTSMTFQALVMMLYHSCTQMILIVCTFDRKMLRRHFKIKMGIYRPGWQKIN